MLSKSLRIYCVGLFLIGLPMGLLAEVKPKVALGRAIFMDTSLSEPAGQGCISCHRVDQAFADPGRAVSPGATPTLFGNRNAPSISYVRFNPEPAWHADDETWIGGFFLDGRARTLHDQAKGPFLNPVEMANVSAAQVIQKIRQQPYANQFTQIYGAHVWRDTDKAFDAVADALASYEREAMEFAPFTSKYDAYLRGEVKLSAAEQRGLTLFEDENKGNCAACHPNQRNDKGDLPLFTDFSYDNIGAPANPAFPGEPDIGLGATAYAHADKERGKFKVQTLRNISRTAPYMHNGVFKTLAEVIDFYNSRDTDKKWGAPEITENLNDDELGDLKLTRQEMADIEAFLETLTDGYRLPAKK